MKEQHKKILVLVIFGTILFLVISNLIRPKDSIIQNQKVPNENNTNIKKIESLTIDLKELNQSNKSGIAILTAENGGKTKITVRMLNSDNKSYPLYIHLGTCEKPIERKHVLVNVKNGVSESVIESSISELITTQSAIVMHKSVNEIYSYLSCGEIKE